MAGREFYERLRTSVLDGALPLQPVRLPHGIVMATLRHKDLAYTGDRETQWDTLTAVAVHLDEEVIGLEAHDHQPVVSEEGVTQSVTCFRHCHSFQMTPDRLTRVRGFGARSDKYDLGAVAAAPMFQPGHSDAKLMREYLDEATKDLTVAKPFEDLFHPGNLDAQGQVPEVLRGHELADQIVLEALAGIGYQQGG